MRRIWPVGLALLLLTAPALAAVRGAADPEQQLVSAMDALRAGNDREALELLSRLTRSVPNFRLAQFLYADLLAARSGHHYPALPDADDPRVRNLIDEADARLREASFIPPPDTVPGNVLLLATPHRYLVIADLPNARLHLFENDGGEPRLIRSHYAGIGRNGFDKKTSGDLRTPVGIYHVTGWMPGAQLPDLYGAGALPLDYPNLWDRFRTKTGHGIWLHGVPRATYVRAPRSSEGCVTMANDDLLALKPYLLKDRAPVVLADRLDWLPRDEVARQREEHLQRIEDWRRKWADQDTEAYLDFYGDDFTTAGMDHSAFVAHKRRVNRSKGFIDVGIDDISLYRYPGEPMMLAEFTLRYRSDNFSSVARKQQYWRQSPAGDWKIFREENLD